MISKNRWKKEPHGRAEPRGAKRHRRAASKKKKKTALQVTFLFFQLRSVCLTYNTGRFCCLAIICHIPLGCRQMSSLKWTNIRFQLPCLTSTSPAKDWSAQSITSTTRASVFSHARGERRNEGSDRVENNRRRRGGFGSALADLRHAYTL